MPTGTRNETIVQHKSATRSKLSGKSSQTWQNTKKYYHLKESESNQNNDIKPALNHYDL